LESHRAEPYDGFTDTASDVGHGPGKGTRVEGLIGTASAMFQPENHLWSRPSYVIGTRDAAGRSRQGLAL